MDIKITPSQLTGEIKAIPSKSQGHRALICAALADSKTTINNLGESEDIKATMACLRALGAEILLDGDGVKVIPVHKASLKENAILPCGESGSTLRFLLPIVAALGLSAELIGEGRLPQRPLSPLYEELINHGCYLSPQKIVPFKVSGQLKPGKFRLAGNVSSQFISSLLFALPLLDGDSEIVISGKLESFPYIELTMAMLGQFGIVLAFDGRGFKVAGNQSYRSPGHLSVEGDWSNAAFWLAAGAISDSSIRVSGLSNNSKQGDRAIVSLLQDFGAAVEVAADYVKVGSGNLKGLTITAEAIPDLVPILAVVAAVAEGTTSIKNAERLRDKESNRLLAITDVLSKLNVDIRETGDGLVINGGSIISGGQVSSFGDHRIAMAAAIAATKAQNPLIITQAEVVKKSYPDFFRDYEALGGLLERIME